MNPLGLAMPNNAIVMNTKKRTNLAFVRVLPCVVVFIGGCQHIQIAKNPIPVSLTPTSVQLETKPLQQTLPQCQDLPKAKNRKTLPPCLPAKNPLKPKKRYFILENWF